MSLKIGNLELKTNVMLAPMAGFTDLAFRHMCLEAGAGLVCTEMVSCSILKKPVDSIFAVLIHLYIDQAATENRHMN